MGTHALIIFLSEVVDNLIAHLQVKLKFRQCELCVLQGWMFHVTRDKFQCYDTINVTNYQPPQLEANFHPNEVIKRTKTLGVMNWTCITIDTEDT